MPKPFLYRTLAEVWLSFGVIRAKIRIHKMRIVMHGQQAFGKAILERLLGGSDEVVAVCCPPDPAKGSIDVLKELALASGLPVHQPKTWKSDEGAVRLRATGTR